MGVPPWERRMNPMDEWKTLSQDLEELEATDPAVRRASEKYDREVQRILSKPPSGARAMSDYIGRVAAKHDPEAVRIIAESRRQKMQARYWWCEYDRCLKARRRRHRKAQGRRNRGGAVFCSGCGARDPRKW